MRHLTLIEGLAAAAATGTAALFVRWARHAQRRPAPVPALRLLHIEHGAEGEDWEPFDPPLVLRDAVADLERQGYSATWDGQPVGGIYPLGEHGHHYVPPGGHHPHWDPGEPMPHFTVDPEEGTVVQHVSPMARSWDGVLVPEGVKARVFGLDVDKGPARSVFLEPGATVYDASDVRWPTQLIAARLRIAPPGSSVVIHQDGSGELVLAGEPEEGGISRLLREGAWLDDEPEWSEAPLAESRNWRAQPPPGFVDVTTFGDPVGRWRGPDGGGDVTPFQWEWTTGLEWRALDDEPIPPAA